MAKKKAAPKKATVKKADGKGVDNQAGQQDLPGVDNNRVPPLETVIKKLVGLQSQRVALKEEIDTLRDKIPPLFEKHELRQYTAHGKTVFVEPGSVHVKIKKAKA